MSWHTIFWRCCTFVTCYSSFPFPAGTDQRLLLSCLPAILQTCTTRSTPPPRTDPECATRHQYRPLCLQCQIIEVTQPYASGDPLPPAVFCTKKPQEIISDHHTCPLVFEWGLFFNSISSKRGSSVGKVLMRRNTIVSELLTQVMLRITYHLLAYCKPLSNC